MPRYAPQRLRRRLHTLPKATRLHAPAMTVPPKYMMRKMCGGLRYASTSTTRLTASIAQRERASFLRSSPAPGRMSLTTEKPISDKNVDADEMPAALMPMSSSMPMTGGSTCVAAQIMASLPGRSPLRLRTNAAAKYSAIVTTMTPMDDHTDERRTTCSSFAMR